MSTSLKTAMGIAGILIATSAAAQVTFYSRDGFRGESFTADREIRNLERSGFNDRAQSAVVQGGSWQVCEDARFEGRCAVLRPGEYPSLSDMGLGREISSVRAVGDRYGYNDDRRYPAQTQAYGAPPVGYVETQPAYPAAPAYVETRPAYPAPAADADYRRRPDERLFEAQVTSVHAVVGPPEQRCWVERRDVGSNANIPGAIAGAVIGGVLGHQIGGGRGQDVATAGGAIAGAAVGANVGRNGYGGSDVQRCTDVSRNDRPDFYDVTYMFDGLEHHVQMSAAPGPTIMVNRAGEPRV